MDIIAQINHIKKSRANKEYGWMKFVIDIVRDYQSKGYTIIQTLRILEEEHELKLSYFSVVNENKRRKEKEEKELKKDLLKTTENISLKKEISLQNSATNKIEQNQDLKNDSSSDSEYVDFTEGLDENIAEKQKREKDILFKTNVKGAKW